MSAAGTPLSGAALYPNMQVGSSLAFPLCFLVITIAEYRNCTNFCVGQNNILFLHHYAKEEPNGFHLSADDRAYQELFNAPSHVPFG